MSVCTCTDGRLCSVCRGRARVIGATWAERVGRREEYRGQTSWPTDDKAQEIALRLVAGLSGDAGMRQELAREAAAGAAAWWASRPMRYREWTLVTADDERKRCCVVVEGVRCEDPTAFEVAGRGGEMDDRTHVCAAHLELVRRSGDVVNAVG